MITQNEEPAVALIVRGMCKLHGLKTSSLELHEYLLDNPGPHYLQDLCEVFELARQNLYKAAKPLLDMGLVVEVGGGGVKGRIGHTKKSYKAAKRCKPIGEQFARKARAFLREVK